MDMRPSVETTEIRAHIKNLNRTMKNHIFDGVDPIRVFKFIHLFRQRSGYTKYVRSTSLCGPAEVLSLPYNFETTSTEVHATVG